MSRTPLRRVTMPTRCPSCSPISWHTPMPGSNRLMISTLTSSFYGWRLSVRSASGALRSGGQRRCPSRSLDRHQQFLVLVGVLLDQLVMHFEDFSVLPFLLIQMLAVPLVQPRRDFVLADEVRRGEDQEVAEQAAGHA